MVRYLLTALASVLRLGRRVTLFACHRVGAPMVYFARAHRLFGHARHDLGPVAVLMQGVALLVWAPLRLAFLGLYHAGLALHAADVAVSGRAQLATG